MVLSLSVLEAMEDDDRDLLLSDRDLIVALNIPDNFFSSSQQTGDEKLLVVNNFPNFKPKGTDIEPANTRQGKALAGEQENPLEGRKPRRENFLSLNLSSNSKFSPAKNSFVHHQVNNVADTLSQDIQQFIKSNPFAVSARPSTPPPSPDTRRSPRVLQREKSSKLIRLEDLREILKNSIKNVDSDLELYEDAPEEIALPPIVLERRQESDLSKRQGRKEADLSLSQGRQESDLSQRRGRQGSDLSQRQGRQGSDLSQRQGRQGRQEARFSTPAQPSPSTLSFANGNTGLRNRLENSRIKNSFDLRQFTSNRAPQKSRNTLGRGNLFDFYY